MTAPPVSVAYARMTRAAELSTALNGLDSALLALQEAIERQSRDTDRERADSRLALVRAVLDATGAGVPEFASWYFSPAPVAVHREAGRTFVLARDPEAHHPGPDDDLAASLVVVVLDELEAKP